MKDFESIISFFLVWMQDVCKFAMQAFDKVGMSGLNDCKLQQRTKLKQLTKLLVEPRGLLKCSSSQKLEHALNADSHGFNCYAHDDRT